MGVIKLDDSQKLTEVDCGVTSVPLKGLGSTIVKIGAQNGLKLKYEIIDIKIAGGFVEGMVAKKQPAVKIDCIDNNKNTPPVILVQRCLIGNKITMEVYGLGGSRYNIVDLDKIHNIEKSFGGEEGTGVFDFLYKLHNKHAQKNLEMAQRYLELLFQIISAALQDPAIFEPETEPAPAAPVAGPTINPVSTPEIPISGPKRKPAPVQEPPKETKHEKKPVTAPKRQPETTPKRKPENKRNVTPNNVERRRTVVEPKPVPEKTVSISSRPEESEGHFLLYITPDEARRGCKKIIKFDHRDIEVQVPPKVDVEQAIIVPNCGYRIGSSDKRGNLVVELMIN